jgi:hypothetical protein
MMGQTSAVRVQRCRQRKRAGLIRLVVELDEDSLCEWLIDDGDGPLSRLDADQHDKVEQVLEDAIALLIADYNQP